MPIFEKTEQRRAAPRVPERTAASLATLARWTPSWATSVWRSPNVRGLRPTPLEGWISARLCTPAMVNSMATTTKNNDNDKHQSTNTSMIRDKQKCTVCTAHVSGLFFGSLCEVRSVVLCCWQSIAALYENLRFEQRHALVTSRRHAPNIVCNERVREQRFFF